MTHSDTDPKAADRLEAVREVARGIAERFPRKYWIRCAREGAAMDQMWQAIGESGLLGLRVPERHGGAGGSVGDLAAVVETLSAAGVPDANLVITGFARLPIVEHGTDEQIRKWVLPTVNGSQRMCFALTEPDAGTNTVNVRSNARKVDGGWAISGQKVFISNAAESHSTVMLCRTGEHDGRPELSLFVFDSRTPGIEYSKLDIGLLSPENQYLVYYDNVLLRDDALVGERGKGLRYLFDGLNPERIFGAAMALGLGEYVLEKAVEYARTRAPFGRPIATYQAVQHPLAKAKAELTAARLLMYEAARRVESGVDAGPYAAMAKYLASRAATEACDAAIQVHGGYGFDNDYDVATLWPVIRLTQIVPVNNEMVLNYLGQQLLGLPKSY